MEALYSSKMCGRRRPANHYSSTQSLFWTLLPRHPHSTDNYLLMATTVRNSSHRGSEIPPWLLQSKHTPLKCTASEPTEKCFAEVLLENKTFRKEHIFNLVSNQINANSSKDKIILYLSNISIVGKVSEVYQHTTLKTA